MVKKKIAYFVIIMIVLILLITIVLSYKFVSSSKEIKIIQISHSFTGEKAEAIQRQLRHYQNLHPLISISEHFKEVSVLKREIEQGTLIPDLFIWEGPVSHKIPFSISKPFFWTGNLWTLAVNTDLLEPSIVENLRNFPSFETFSQTLTDIKQAGIVPVSVGNSHYWPLTIWEQHIGASILEGNYLDVFPVLTDFNSEINKVWDILQTWKRNGYFYEDVWDAGWARGLIAVSEGNAAMALMSGNMITTIPLEQRSHFIFIPFPQADINNRWGVGSGSSLIKNIDSEYLKETEDLMKYLTSQAVAELLTKETKILFYSTEQPSARVFVPSWETLANSPEMRKYSGALRAYVMD